MKAILIAALFFLMPDISSFGNPTYAITALSTPSGGSVSQPTVVSGGGIIGGGVSIGSLGAVNSYIQPVLWQNGGVTSLTLPAGMSGIVTGVNNNGDAVGGIWSGPAPSNATPVLWKNGSLQVLALPDATAGGPSAINQQGDIVGGVDSNTETLSTGFAAGYAVAWANGQPASISNFPNMEASATAVNNHGQILLVAGDGKQTYTTIFSDDTLTPIPAITGNVTSGAAINEIGQVVGTSLSSDGTFHAFLYENGTTLDLGRAPAEESSSAIAINNSGQIVGNGYRTDGDGDALLWENGQLFNLADLIPADSSWTLVGAAGIADDGSIVGIGFYQNEEQAFLLTPNADGSLAPFGVREPASISLLALGALPLLFRRGFRRAKS